MHTGIKNKAMPTHVEDTFVLPDRVTYSHMKSLVAFSSPRPFLLGCFSRSPDGELQTDYHLQIS